MRYISIISSFMLQNGTQMVLRMYIKSIKIRIWGMFFIKMVFEVISGIILIISNNFLEPCALKWCPNGA